MIGIPSHHTKRDWQVKLVVFYRFSCPLELTLDQKSSLKMKIMTLKFQRSQMIVRHSPSCPPSYSTPEQVRGNIKAIRPMDESNSTQSRQLKETSFRSKRYSLSSRSSVPRQIFKRPLGDDAVFFQNDGRE
jgi:hypothetical protein